MAAAAKTSTQTIPSTFGFAIVFVSSSSGPVFSGGGGGGERVFGGGQVNGQQPLIAARLQRFEQGGGIRRRRVEAHRADAVRKGAGDGERVFAHRAKRAGVEQKAGA